MKLFHETPKYNKIRKVKFYIIIIIIIIRNSILLNKKHRCIRIILQDLFRNKVMYF